MLLEEISDRSTGRNLYLVIQNALKVEMRKSIKRELKDSSKLRKNISRTTKNMIVGTVSFRYLEIFINDNYAFMDVPIFMPTGKAFFGISDFDMLIIWE